MKTIIITLFRYLLGAIFLVFGVNGLLEFIFNAGFIKVPPMQGVAGLFFSSLMRAHILETVKIVEVVAALMLLSGVFLPLGILLLAPIIVNIFLFHLNIEHTGLPIAVILLVGELVLGWAYWENFKSLFTIHKGIKK